ncbi:hypothetical protein BOKEGFJH_00583 [Chlamydia avium]|uniref:Uncharacterized protein n=2 Tax=Chlamydia avium TaxID=1457141 RepID=W8K0P0_9CHLA|nr:hypothetical protein [Chlamydia avium]AHK63457.1 Uncharacterized protein M832_05940 [Chlamydia avium 10DC88]EPP36993.1 hypothetical protein CP10743SC13_0936 [Chlamydia psittaci 10_743_SC13]EPP38831.1 hypothetical protein CP10881SC42_0031 [Chlamydia avium]VVT43053.1 hypothetical protein BOKEGFJH_00583 [Chlamydia avium]
MFCRSWLILVITVCCCFLEGFGSQSETILQTVPPQYRILSSGNRIYYSYSAALENAIAHHKLGIIVFLNPSSDDVWEDITKRDLYLSKDLTSVFNFVILQPGLINSMEFHPKIDPMIHHIVEFQERFSNISIHEPCIVLITIDSQQQDSIQHVFPRETTFLDE